MILSKPLSEKAPWLAFVILGVMFFFVDGNDLFRTLSKKGTVENSVTTVEEGRLDRRLGFLGLLAFAGLDFFRKSRKSIRIHGGLGWLMVMFLAWAFYSLAWTEDFALTSRRFIVLLILFVSVLATARRFSVKDLLLWLFLTLAVYVSMGLVMEIIFGNFRPFDSEYRFAGTLHPNHQGINCALLLLIGVFLADYFQRARKYIWLVALLAAILLILTKSRTSFISVGVALAIYWSIKSSKINKFATIAGVIIGLATLLLIFDAAIFSALQNMILLGRESDAESVYSLTERVPLWKTCFDFIGQRLIHGYGYGGFWTEQNIRAISSSQKWLIGESHSAYVEIALGLGLFGVMLFVMLQFGGLLSAFALYRRTQNTDYAFLAHLTIFCCIDGFLESAIVFPSLVMFLNYFVFVYLGFIKESKPTEVL